MGYQKTKLKGLMSLNRTERKEIIKNKLEHIQDMKSKYEQSTNLEEIKNYEIWIEGDFEEMKYDFGRKLPFKYTSLKLDYEEIKKRKKFILLHCIRCSSNENMTYHTLSKKRHMRSGPIAIQHTVTYQHFEYDFPVCGACKKKISLLKTINTLILILLIGWIVGFVGVAVYILFIEGLPDIFLGYLPPIYFYITAVGALIILIGKISLRFLKHWPRRFIKIKVKFRGWGKPHRGKNYEGIPMVKPVDSKKWVLYESWLESFRWNY